MFNNPFKKPVAFYNFKELSKDELLGITAIEFFERYKVKTLTTHHLGHENLICCHTDEHEFIVKPYDGKCDWELLIKRLERAQYGVFTLIERPPEKDN